MTRRMKPSSDLPNHVGAPLPDVVVVDACVLLNLYASGRVEEILTSVHSCCLVSRYVCREALWFLASTGQAGDKMERSAIVLDPLVRSGLLTIVDLTLDEQRLFVVLAQELGDGEAASGALAICRSAGLATDDSRARQVFGRQMPPVRVIGTATLLRLWESSLGVDASTVATTLKSIRLGARFHPRSDDEDATWWRNRIRGISNE